MIVCKVCGTENERGASFCGSCGSFLEWSGERVEPDAPAVPTPPEPNDATGPHGQQPTSTGNVPPVPPARPDATPTEPVPPVPATGNPEPSIPGGIICPTCGQENEPTRVYCKRCATELAPAGTPVAPVLAEPPRARSVPPVAILGGIGAIAVVAVLGAVILLPKGTPGPSSEASLSSAPTAPGSPSAGTASVPPSTPASPDAGSVPPSAPPALTGLIVFSAVRNGNADLWIWDPADDEIRRLVRAAGNQVDPAWSPDGSEVVYATGDGLRIVTADGEPADPPDLTHHGEDRHPAWSPDGKTVVFATNRKPFTSLNIATRPADDNKADLDVLVNNGADDWDPTWSPDGSEIVFASKRGGHQRLYIMNADGGNETEVPLGSGLFDDPMFSPDGEWLAFTRRESASKPKALYVARVDGSEMRRLTHSNANENDMSWSPDGRTIAVVRADDDYKIVLVDVATGDETGTIGVDGAQNKAPDWWWPRP